MKLLFLFVSSLLAIYAFAQKNEYGNIKGVVSTSDGKPAGSVTVVIKNTKNGTTTKDDGSFELKRIKPGNYVIILSFVTLSVHGTFKNLFQNHISAASILLSSALFIVHA